MCPVCAATAALVVIKATSAGGIATVSLKKLLSGRALKKIQEESRRTTS
jgi:hypothetical protein